MTDQESTPHERGRRDIGPLKSIIRPVLTLALAALSSRLSQASMSPVYGSINVSINHNQAMAATVLLGLSMRLLNLTNVKLGPEEIREPSKLRYHLPIYAFWIPFIELQISRYSETLGVIGGPILTGLLTCHSIIVASSYIAAEDLENLRLRSTLGTIPEAAIIAASCVSLFTGFERIFSHWLTIVMLEYGKVDLSSLQVIAAAIYAISAPSWFSLLGAVAAWQMLLSNPHHSSVALRTQLNHVGNWSVVERRWSTTGYLSVIDDLDRHVRFLRCDHSILGGEWILTEDRKEKERWAQNEPIYSVFEMLEAVRLVERDVHVPDLEAQALVIGAGIGTAPTALIKHGIQTTVVEVDPVVHEFATKYFGLPAGHIKVVEDAVVWTAETAKKVARAAASSPSWRSAGIYDYIIHDVFTGGAEPLNLFSKEFLFGLRTLLKDEGIIAMNYAGSLGEPLMTTVLNTIDFTFGHDCKMFSDSSEVASKWRDHRASPSDEALRRIDGMFSNLVIFCRKTPSPFDKFEADHKLQQPITFRKPKAADYLGTISRQHYLVPGPEQEIKWHWGKAWEKPEGVDHTFDGQDVLRLENVWTWEPEIQSSAKKHWAVMRKVLPARIWELY